MIAAISSTVRSPMEQRSRPHKRLDASLKAVSDWIPKVAVGFGVDISSLAASVGFEFITTVLLPMSFFSCRHRAGVCCVGFQYLVEGVDRDLNVLTFKNEWRQEAKNSLAGSVDDYPSLHHLPSPPLPTLSQAP